MSPRKYLSQLFLFSILVLIYPLISKSSNQLALAQTIIAVPVNSVNQGKNSFSPSNSSPVTSNSGAFESSFPNLEDIIPPQPIAPLPRIIPATEKIIVKGDSTPQTSSWVGNNLITSSEMLPLPPILSDPYERKEETVLITEANNSGNNDRKLNFRQTQSNNNYRNISTRPAPTQNTSQYVAPEPVSISPFNQTPTDNPNLSNNGQNKRPLTIDVSPNNRNSAQSAKTPVVSSSRQKSPSTNSTNIPTNTNNIKPNYVNSSKKRRTLADILVFAGGNSVNNNSTDNNLTNNNPVSFTSQNSSLSYKVLVLAAHPSIENEIKSLYPEAFNTQYQGKKFLQVGLFRDKANAEEVIDFLRSYGLNPLIIPQK